MTKRSGSGRQKHHQSAESSATSDKHAHPRAHVATDRNASKGGNQPSGKDMDKDTDKRAGMHADHHAASPSRRSRRGPQKKRRRPNQQGRFEQTLQTDQKQRGGKRQHVDAKSAPHRISGQQAATASNAVSAWIGRRAWHGVKQGVSRLSGQLKQRLWAASSATTPTNTPRKAAAPSRRARRSAGRPYGQHSHKPTAARCEHAIGFDIQLPSVPPPSAQPLCLSRDQHQLESRYISPAAIKVLKTLAAGGFKAYVVGGGVRDVLLGRAPKDFDVATDAHPEQVKQLFPRGRIIGRRFRLVHVYFRGEVIEVSTFRASNDVTEASELGTPELLASDNVYGTIEEDAWRRDFTVNALYYSHLDGSLLDYTGGLHDLQQRILRVIGDPHQRFHEDPIRMLRAIRMAAKLELTIEPQAAQLCQQLHHLLTHVPAARLFDEILKLLFHGHAQATYAMLQEYGFVRELFPQSVAALEVLQDPRLLQLQQAALKVTDKRYHHQQSLNPGFLLSVFLWPVLLQKVQHRLQAKRREREHERETGSGMSLERTASQQDSHQKQQPALPVGLQDYDDLLQLREPEWQQIVASVVREQSRLHIPRRFLEMMRDIWLLQWYFAARQAYKVRMVLHMRYFRAGSDFLELRSQIGFGQEKIHAWWWPLREAGQQQIDEAIASLPTPRSKRRRRGGRRRQQANRSKPNE